MRRYRNFDLELYGHRVAGGQESFLVRVARAPAGDQKIAEASAVALPAGLRAELDRLEAGAVGAGELVSLGARLGELLLPSGTVRDLFDLSLLQLGEDEGLRLRLRVEEPAVASLPWELAYLLLPATPAGEGDERGFLCLRPELSLSRYEPLPRPPKPFTPVERPRLVCLTSNPELPGTGRLDLAGERERIEAALAPAPVDAVFAANGTLEALQESLRSGAHLFHFGGHGTFTEEALGEIPRTAEGEGYLLFEDAEGRAQAVPAETVALNLVGRKVRVALLNSCYSGRRDAIRAWTGVGPVLAHERLPAVVANQFRVEDRAALAFARGFYAELAAGAPIDSAVAAGRLAIFNLDPPTVADWGSYVLYLRLADESDGVVFPQRAAGERPTRLFWANLALAAAALVALVVVFYRQLEPRLPPSWIAFGGIGLLGLAALVWAFVQFFAGEEIRSALRRGLASRAGTVVGGAALLAALAVTLLVAVPTSPVLVLPYLPVHKMLPQPGNDAGSVCSLEAVTAAGPLWALPAIERRTIVLGASKEELRARLSDEELERELRRVLDGRGVKGEAQDAWIRLWSTAPRFEPDRNWAGGAPVTLRLVRRGETAPLWRSRPTAPADLAGSVVKLWLMEANDGSTISTCVP